MTATEIARVIRANPPGWMLDQENLARAFAGFLAATDPEFDTAPFYDAAGVGHLNERRVQ